MSGEFRIRGLTCFVWLVKVPLLCCSGAVVEVLRGSVRGEKLFLIGFAV
jgi:hypothetical protein